MSTVLKEGITPCYKCPDRSESCHASCLKYLDWQKEHIEENKNKKAFEDSNKEFYTEGKIRFIEKGLKRIHNKGILRNIK